MAKATMESKRIKKVGKLKERSAKIAKKKEDASLEITTPYPKEEKKSKSDVDFIGGELAKLSERLNELELSFNDLSLKLDRVTGRMGL